MENIEQLLVDLILAVSCLCGKVINFEIVERRSLKSRSTISANTLFCYQSGFKVFYWKPTFSKFN